MQKLKNIFKNELFIILINSVIIHLAFVAVVLTIYQGAPDILADSALVEILQVFEG